MGPLIQRTILRLEATKLDQNAKSRVVADVGKKCEFSAAKKDGVQMEGRVLWIPKTSQDPTVFFSFKSQAIGFTEKAKLTMKAKEGSYLEVQESGMEIWYQLRGRNFSSVLAVQLAGNFLPMPSEEKAVILF